MTAAHEIVVGGEVISFHLKRCKRKTLGITVHPDSAVTVTAPEGAALEDVMRKVGKRAGWILRSRREFEAWRPRTPARRYVAGETHLYLGRQYRLQLEPSLQDGVELTSTHLVVGGIEAEDSERIRRRVGDWYQERAKEIFAARYEHCRRRVLGRETTSPRLAVRTMKRRWGSLSPNGRTLMLNRRLVEASSRLIDYVIVHELCHLAHADHGHEFYQLMASKMPDWARRKSALERFLV